MRYLFVSYARSDADAVLPIVDAVDSELKRRGLHVPVWLDVNSLEPGQQWALEIARVLQEALGLLVFVSPRSMESRFVSYEIATAAARSDRLIIPVILRHVSNLPLQLQLLQWLDLSGRRGERDLQHAAQQIVDAVETRLQREFISPPITPDHASEAAASIARDIRSSQRGAVDTGVPPDSVFVVHGHDLAALSEMEEYLTSVGVRPIILSRLGSAQSLLQKFFQSADDARFAIVIISADDMGASLLQYDTEGVGERALQFRARQNVILELGFFYGRLDWEQVFVLQRPSAKIFPNFERPSDIDGVVFDTMDLLGGWRKVLARKLSEAGFQLNGPDRNPSA